MMSIHTVAAGGGSILEFDGCALSRRPAKRGRQSRPGELPARRAAGGDRRERDGRQDPAALLPEGVRARARTRRSATKRCRPSSTNWQRKTGRSAEEVAEGFIDIAVQQMANAIKKISVARGYDVTRYTLQCFGGAGGQHACLVADALGMSRVFVHPLAGVLSAYGMGLADQNVIREQAIELPLAPDSRCRWLPSSWMRWARRRRPTWNASRSARARCSMHRRVHVRYEGSDSALVVPFGDLQTIVAGFEAAYRQRFAFLMQGKSMMVEAVSVEAVVAGDAPAEPRHEMHPSREVPRRETVRMYSGGQWHEAALVVREDLRAGDVIAGPAIIAEKNATTVVEPGWEAQLTALDHLVLDRRRAARRDASRPARTVDPVLLEVFNNLFMNIAEQMGLQLQNTAYSVNIKERLDFSCALFDARRQPDRQRAAHAGAPGLDGREHQDRDPRERGPHVAGRRVRAERSVPRRHASAGRDGDHAGVPGQRARGQASVLRGLARPPRRHRRHHAGLDAAVLDAHRGRGRADQQRQAGGPRHAARSRDAGACCAAAPTPAATPSRTWRT